MQCPLRPCMSWSLHVSPSLSVLSTPPILVRVLSRRGFLSLASGLCIFGSVWNSLPPADFKFKFKPQFKQTTRINQVFPLFAFTAPCTFPSKHILQLVVFVSLFLFCLPPSLVYGLFTASDHIYSQLYAYCLAPC